MRILSRAWIGSLCLISITGIAFSQQTGQQGGGTQGGAGAAAPTTGAAPSRDPGGQQGGRQQIPGFEQPGRQQQRPMEQRPIFLSGKVVMEDGTPPPDFVTIETVCNGTTRPQAYTDSKGRFSFQLGAQNNVMMDASVSSAGGAFGRDGMGTMGNMGGLPSMGGSGMGAENLMGCELRAALPGFRSEAIVLNRRSMFDNPDVGTIILRRLANVQGTAISYTTLAAPKDAKKSYEKAQKIMQQKNPKHAEAAKELEKAVEMYPEFAAAWYLLGEAKLAMKDEDGARKAFEKSLTADAKYVNPYLQLAVLDLRSSQWASAADMTKRVTQLNPHLTQAHYFNAIANYNLGKMELAEKSVRSVVESEAARRMPKAYHLLGAILARQGNFPSAAENFRSYLRLAPNSTEADQLRRQLTEWEGLGVIQRAEIVPQTPTTNKEKQ